MRIMGVDPGSIRTGFAFLEVTGRQIRHLGSGTILLESDEPISDRLLQLSNDFDHLIKKYRPTEFAIESLFFAKNAQSALKLGHARGVILMRAAAAGLQIHEYTPAEVKVSLVGSGRAQKEQVAQMIQLLLKLPKTFEFSSTDQSDALAIALTHVQSKKIKGFKNDRATYWQTGL